MKYNNIIILRNKVKTLYKKSPFFALLYIEDKYLFLKEFFELPFKDIQYNLIQQKNNVFETINILNLWCKKLYLFSFDKLSFDFLNFLEKKNVLFIKYWNNFYYFSIFYKKIKKFKEEWWTLEKIKEKKEIFFFYKKYFFFNYFIIKEIKRIFTNILTCYLSLIFFYKKILNLIFKFQFLKKK